MHLQVPKRNRHSGLSMPVSIESIYSVYGNILTICGRNQEHRRLFDSAEYSPAAAKRPGIQDKAGWKLQFEIFQMEASK